MAPSERHGDAPPRYPGTECKADAIQALIRAEAAVCETIFATESVASPRSEPRLRSVGTASDAIRGAVLDGKRASVVIGAEDVLRSLDALAEAAMARAPIVVHVVTSGHGTRAGRTAGRDELAPALDVGAGVLVTWSAQDAVDAALVAHRAAEDSETPFLHVFDGPTGAGAPVLLPDPALVTHFLGPHRGAGGRAAGGDLERKQAERSYASRVPFALGSAMREIGELTGRGVAPIERHDTLDAEEILVAVGAAFRPARELASSLRREGRRVGALGLRSLRPFFAADAVKAVARARAIVVLEPLDVALAPSGPMAASLKAAFADALTWAPGFPGVGRIPPIVSALFATLAEPIDQADVRAALDELGAGDRARRVVVFGSDGQAG